MINPISPQFVRLIHEEKERELLYKIELVRNAKERGTYEEVSSFEQIRTWYAQASQWMKVNLFSRAVVGERASSQHEAFEEPCVGVPC